MRKLFGVFVLCVLMSVHVCGSSGFAHTAATLFNRGIDLTAKAFDDFIPDVSSEKYSLERLIRKHELTFGEKNLDGDSLLGLLGIKKSRLPWSGKIPKEVGHVLTCYRIGRHWYKNQFGQVQADSEFLKGIAIASEKNKTTLLKRVIAQHIIDIYEENRLTNDFVYAGCWNVMRQSSVVEKDAESIYKYFLAKELDDAKTWLFDVLCYEQDTNVPDGLRGEYEALLACIHSRCKIDDFKTRLVEIENAKRNFCRASNEVYKKLLDERKLEQPSLRNTLITGSQRILNVTLGFERPYEEGAQSLAAAWRLAHPAGPVTEGPGFVSFSGGASAGPGGAGSGAGAAGAGGPLVPEDEVHQLSDSLQQLQDFLDGIGCQHYVGSISGIKEYLDSCRDVQGACSMLQLLLADVNYIHLVSTYMVEFVQEYPDWSPERMSCVHSDAIKSHIAEVDTAARFKAAQLTIQPALDGEWDVGNFWGDYDSGVPSPAQASEEASVLTEAPAPSPANPLELADYSPPASVLSLAPANPSAPSPAPAAEVAPVFTEEPVASPANPLELADYSPPASVLSLAPANPSAPSPAPAAEVAPVFTEEPVASPANPLELADYSPPASVLSPASVQQPVSSPASAPFPPLAAEEAPVLTEEPVQAKLKQKWSMHAKKIAGGGTVLALGSLAYLAAELSKNPENRALVSWFFKKLRGKKVAPLTPQQRRSAGRLKIDAAVAIPCAALGVAAVVAARCMRG